MFKLIKNILLYLWQLPQNLLGLAVIVFTGAKKQVMLSSYFYMTEKRRFWVSLGKYIIFGGHPSKTSIQHERGHQKQSLYLGWIYLLIIGIPSACGNLYDRLFHKNWNSKKRCDWYYSLPWESWADRLGGVER